MSNELALSEVMTLGEALAASGYFSDVKQASQAIVKVLAGQELGIGPVASMSGINIIKGKAEISGNVLASLVKSSGKYNYQVREITNEFCLIEFFEQGTSIGVSEFSLDDAKRAGLEKKDTYKNFPRNMLFNRAMSNGVKWYCPDVTNGQVVYTPNEIDDDFIVDMPELIPEKVVSQADQQALNEGRAKWIEDIVKQPNFPKDGNPMEKVTFINAVFEERGLEFKPVKPAEIMSMAG